MGVPTENADSDKLYILNHLFNILHLVFFKIDGKTQNKIYRCNSKILEVARNNPNNLNISP